MKPMLAANAPAELRFPMYASPKLDGIRCVVKDGVALSRSLKPIRNEYVQSYLNKEVFHGLDGELIVGEPFAKDVFAATSSGVMSRDGEPDFTFHVFDYYTDSEKVYRERLELLKYHWSLFVKHDRAKLLQQTVINDEAHLLAYEVDTLACGYEGVMLRSFDGKYKYGRSTQREHYLLKLKRFTDSEAVVTGVVELMHNANEAQTDALGNTKRSSHQDNLLPAGTLGSLQVVDCNTGVEFNIGTGYSAKHRSEIWEQRDKVIGATVKYKFFEIGVKDAPRFPVWLGFRDPIDM